MNVGNNETRSHFNPDYPIRTPCQLRVSFKAFWGPEEKKDKWIYEKPPRSDIFLFPTEITENMVVYLAGLLTPLFGWRTLNIQDLFPDATYEDITNHAIIKVEFEKQTRDFLEHQHPASGCDIILCWEDNLTKTEKDERLFAENPNLQIVELKKIFFHYDLELILAK